MLQAETVEEDAVEKRKSGTQKAARAAKVVGGLAKIAIGIASQNYAQAVIGAVEVIPWKTVFIILGVVLFIVLLPVLIISSIPQILFNWATSGIEELINRNMHSESIVSYYYEFLEEQDDDVDPDINRLICIQAVLSNQDVESISKSDVEDMILASYTVDNNNKVYNKSAKEIMDDLGMDEEQQNWANLMYNTITGQRITPGSSFIDPDTLETYEGIEFDGVVYFNQLDARWANEMYGITDTIGVAGCGPTALAIAISTLKGEAVSPLEVANWSADNGYVCEGSGSYISLIPNAAEHYGLTVEKLGKSSGTEIKQHLNDGKLIIALMGRGHFTSSGHFIVLRGISEDGRILVADPVSYNRSTKEWDLFTILDEVKDAGSGGPFWALSYQTEEEDEE